MKRGNHKSGPHRSFVDQWPFVAALRQPVKRAFRYCRHRARPDEADLSGGVRLGAEFKSALLETAYCDLETFLREARIPVDGCYPVVCREAKTSCFEEYIIDISRDGCLIRPGDTEGMRRAIFALEEMLLASEGPFLPLGRIRKKPWLKNRISRCYFGPIKRPPFNRDELMDDVDYYPDEYLNRLAHEGINGLWLTVEWRDLCKTSITKTPPDAPRRLAKLRRTVEKCARYGIKTWIFHIEPVAWKNNDPLLKKYPELGGMEQGGERFFCPSGGLAQRYIRESVNHIFKSVPGLGGIINITHGERTTTCLSAAGSWMDHKIECPRCSKIPKWRIIYRALAAMRDGMKAAAPDAELIAWFYMPNARYPARWVHDVAAHMPRGVIFQYNFESNLRIRQSGKIMAGGDYWLSGVGPAANFRRLAKTAVSAGTEVSAKLQVCCSHEVATVPFVPVPGILYRKYKQLHNLGGKHAMQCWYFGNYPGLMHRASGALAFENFQGTESQFLLALARPDWGAAAGKAAEAWRWFSDAYVNYPLDNMMQYYGPMHSGAAWPLYLKLRNIPLAPTWLHNFPPSGDAIGECLSQHNLEGAIALTASICRKWAKGLKIMQRLAASFKDNPERMADIRLAEALGLHFGCARNIMEFYLLRRRLFEGRGVPGASLGRMEKILFSEISIRSRLARLCILDGRLGFHPEAEAYQYTRKNIMACVRGIKSLLSRDIPALRAGLAAGNIKKFTADRRPVFKIGAGWIKQRTFRWRPVLGRETLAIEVEAFPVSGHDAHHFHLCLLDRYSTGPALFLYFSQYGEFHNFRTPEQIKWRVVPGAGVVRGSMNIPLGSIPWLTRDRAMACTIYRFLVKNGGETEYDAFPSSAVPARPRLGMCRFAPESFGVIEFG